MEKPPVQSMPAVFIGHGNPMNVLQHTRWSESWVALGENLPRPGAILVVSAHWYLPATMVTAMPHPRTIHDFSGFPQELYDVKYPAPGDPALAERVRDLLAPIPVILDRERGLDHGAWSVLGRIFPEADIPVVQLSIDRTKPPSFHLEVGRRLAPLRDEGVLLLGSGNLAHNLRTYRWDRPDEWSYEWAARFEEQVRTLLRKGEVDRLADYRAMGPDAELSVPTPDHYLPLLYVLGARRDGEAISYPVEGFEGGSMSMLAVQVSRQGH